MFHLFPILFTRPIPKPIIPIRKELACKEAYDNGDTIKLVAMEMMGAMGVMRAMGAMVQWQQWQR